MSDPAARAAARQAARAIRAAIADPSTAGEKRTAHLNYGRKRHVWVRTWASLPGLTLDAGGRFYTHTLLPGWVYTPAEMRTEMIDDLEHFAETGEQPKVATR